jgi:hypothetical protein
MRTFVYRLGLGLFSLQTLVTLAQDDQFPVQPQVPAFFYVLAVAIAIVSIISLWMIFQKAGKPGWASIVPFYNLWVLKDITGRPTWWFFVSFIPYVGSIFVLIMYYFLGRSFGKSTSYSVGVALLSVVFLPMLAFSNDRYQGAPA